MICVWLGQVLLEKRVYWGVYVGIMVHIVDNVRVTVAVIIAVIVAVYIAIDYVVDSSVIIVRITVMSVDIRRTHPTITVDRTVSGSIIIRVITVVHRILIAVHSVHRTHAIIIPRNHFYTTLMRYWQPVHAWRVTTVRSKSLVRLPQFGHFWSFSE